MSGWVPTKTRHLTRISMRLSALTRLHKNPLSLRLPRPKFGLATTKLSVRVFSQRKPSTCSRLATPFPRSVFDGTRNSGEIQYLRKRFGHRFFLFALECPASERWERLKPQYEARGETFQSFTADDKRDKDEEGPFGHRGAVAVSSRADFSGEGGLARMLGGRLLQRCR